MIIIRDVQVWEGSVPFGFNQFAPTGNVYMRMPSFFI